MPKIKSNAPHHKTKFGRINVQPDLMLEFKILALNKRMKIYDLADCVIREYIAKQNKKVK